VWSVLWQCYLLNKLPKKVSIVCLFHNYTYVYLKLIKLKLVSKAKLLAITEAYAYLGQRYSSRPLSGGLTSGPITGIYGTRRAIRLHKPKTVSMEHKETSLFKRWSLGHHQNQSRIINTPINVNKNRYWFVAGNIFTWIDNTKRRYKLIA